MTPRAESSGVPVPVLHDLYYTLVDGVPELAPNIGFQIAPLIAAGEMEQA